MLNRHRRRRGASGVVLAVLVTSITPCLLGALQPTPSHRPVQIQGVRQQRAYYVASRDFNLWAAATSDGLVEIWSEPGRQDITVRPTDLKTIRDFFTVDEVVAWSDSAETMVRGPRSARWQDQYRIHQTPRPHARSLEASFISTEPTGLRIRVELGRCPRTGTARADMPPASLQTWIAALRAAAEDARAQRNTTTRTLRADPSAVYWQHAVGCPAEPLASNGPPDMPPGVDQPYELLAEFIVDSDGAVALGSLRVPAGSDRRYVAELERVLPQWRFTRPARAGRVVSQVVHMPVRFGLVPPTTNAPACVDGPTRGLAPRLSAPNARTALLPPGYLTVLARRMALLSDLPAPGTTVGFVVQRYPSISDIRMRSGRVESPPDPAFARALGMLPASLESLPESYPDDALGVEVDVLAHCPPRGAVALRTAEFRAAAHPDGRVHLSWVSFWDAATGFREPPVWRDVVDPRELVAWVDSVEARVRIDTAATAQSSFRPDFIPGGPILGYSGTRGLRVGLTVPGILRGGVYCGRYTASLAITPTELPSVGALVRRAAADAASLRSRPDSARDTYWEHEVACPATPVPDNPRPTFPSLENGSARSSHEVLVSLVVDTSGVPDSATVRAIPGSDSLFAAQAERDVREWRFSPALRGGMRVRQVAHVPVLFRPDDGDATLTAVAVGSPVPQAHPPLAGQRASASQPPTIFSRPPARPGSAARGARRSPPSEPDAGRVDGMERLERAMQPYVEQARASYPAAKARFLAGLPRGFDFFVTARLRDRQGRWEQVFVAVDRIENGRIRGRIASPVRLLTEYRLMQPYELAEADVMDWTIVDPIGVEEGNVVGKFLDTYRAAAPRQR